jgi:hypothetical protein
MPTVWAVSFSLAATREVALAFSSCGYLDVSVPHVRSVSLCIQLTVIRESQDQRSFDSSPRHFAAFHALHRLLAPRHPPHALIYLANLINRHDIYTILFYRLKAFAPSPSLGNVYRCHLDFIRLSKISRKIQFPEGLFFASGGLYRALWPLSIPLSKIFYFFFFSSGDDRDRTDNLCLARAALSQLSYVPESRPIVHLGFTAPRTQPRQSPNKTAFPDTVFHQCTSFAVHRTTKVAPKTPNQYQWAYVDSNHGPQLYQSCALTI